MESRILASAVFVIACFFAESYAFVASDCEPGNGWFAMEAAETTKPGANVAESAIIDLDADSIVLGKPFSFSLRLCADELKKPDRLTANATMPAHKHGMNYTPTVVFDKESDSYKVEGFLFHMPGEWEITLAMYRDDKASHYTRSVTIQ